MKDPSPPVTYADYLKIDQLLSLQSEKSAERYGKAAHEELLFIVVHQAYELWFKQILHELDSVTEIFKKDYIDERHVGIAVLRLRRILEIQKILIEQIRVLETMTPLDFLDFRDLLAPASGFQSYQFRLIENKLGLRREQRKLFDKTQYDEHLEAKHRELVRQSENEPSLFVLVGKWLERTPFIDFKGFNFWQSYRGAVETMLNSDKEAIQNNPNLSDEDRKKQLAHFVKTTKEFTAIFDESEHDRLREKGVRRMSFKALQAALLINLYRDEPILHLPFRLLTSLIDIDDLMTTWRHRHALMVQRMIGAKVGTGGSSGHHYLRAVAEGHKIFTDLTNLSTFFIPRSKLPKLPDEVQRNLGFYYSKQEA
ncbi:MAG: tryptophan 2,3-dioxygenase family protein [bacterium]